MPTRSTSTLPSKTFSKRMLLWYHQHGRKHLPWQLDQSPYHTWLSEIMLQQTQVQTVIPYYEAFKIRFPDIHTLAQASQDEVLHLWTGLGYYSRARNLHRCAQIISEEHQGQFPDSVEALAALPGIGRSTAGAILSLAMGKPAAILDGNVKRVFCRYFRIDGWPGDNRVQKELWQIAEALLPEKEAGHYNQSLMDLGATLCKRSKPECERCPLASDCQASKDGVQTLYPHKKARKSLPQKQCHMLILQNSRGHVYLEQRPNQGLWGGLWSLPEFDSLKSLKQHCQQQGFTVDTYQKLPAFKHTFSHFQLSIQPVLCTVSLEPARIGEAKGIWYHGKSPALGMATPIKTLIEQVQA